MNLYKFFKTQVFYLHSILLVEEIAASFIFLINNTHTEPKKLPTQQTQLPFTYFNGSHLAYGFMRNSK